MITRLKLEILDVLILFAIVGLSIYPISGQEDGK